MESLSLQVKIENISPNNGIVNAGVWFGLHDGEFDFFNVGEPTSESLEILVEDGLVGLEEQVAPGALSAAVAAGLDISRLPASIQQAIALDLDLETLPAPPGTLAGEFLQSTSGQNSGTQGLVLSSITSNPLFFDLLDDPSAFSQEVLDMIDNPFFLTQASGEIETTIFTLNGSTEQNRFFSYAAMLFPTNDGFIANDNPQAHEIFDIDGNFLGANITVLGDQAYDAGTEVNDESFENLLYTFEAFGSSVDENGVIQEFPGFMPSMSGGILDFSFNNELVAENADFTVPDYQILQISVGAQFQGDAEQNIFQGGVGDDTVAGGDGDDILGGGAGIDSLDGGAGIDTVDFSDEASGIIVDLDISSAGAAGTPSQDGAILDAPPAAGGNSLEEVDDFENIIGSNFGDGLFGNNEVNNIQGGLGDDTIHGFAGDDTLDGGEGIDTLLFSAAPSGVIVDLSAGTALGGAGTNQVLNFENVNGSSSNDILGGDQSANNLFGNTGDDILIGNGGDDTVRGGEGFDTAVFSGLQSSFTITEGEGSTTVSGASGTTVLSDVEVLQFDDALLPDTLTVVDVESDDTIINGLVINTAPAGPGVPANARLADDVLALGNDAVFDNLVGFYQITDTNGGIDTTGDGVADLLPDSEGYAREAITRRVANFSVRAGSSGDPSLNTTAEQFGDAILAGGQLFAPFVIANGGGLGFDGFLSAEDSETDGIFNDPADFIDDQVAYFSFLGANPDQVSHLQSRGNNVFGFEDLPNNIFSDMDFNDAIFSFSFTP